MAASTFLGGVLPTALSALTTANAVRRTTQNAQIARQTYQTAQADHATRQSDLTNALAAQETKNRVATETATAERNAALRRAMARQRANFGAQGIDSADGSAEAILLGLTQQSAEEQERQNTLDRLRDAALRDDAARQSRKNLLELNQAYDKARLSALYRD